MLVPYLSPGVGTLPLAPILFSPGANGPPLEASAPPFAGPAPRILASPSAGEQRHLKTVCCRPRPSGAPGETLPGGASGIIIGPGSPVRTATVAYLTILVFLNTYS